MVKIPKTRRAFCPSCETHADMKVSHQKNGKRNPNRQGERRYRLKQQGFGGQTRPIFKKPAKTTKKIQLKLECKDCGKKNMKVLHRARQVLLTNEKKVKGKALDY